MWINWHGGSPVRYDQLIVGDGDQKRWTPVGSDDSYLGATLCKHMKSATSSGAHLAGYPSCQAPELWEYSQSISRPEVIQGNQTGL